MLMDATECELKWAKSMHAEQVWPGYVAHSQMWNLITVHHIFPGENRHEKIVLMSIEVYLADGSAFFDAKLQKVAVNTWLNLQIFL